MCTEFLVKVTEGSLDRKWKRASSTEEARGCIVINGAVVQICCEGKRNLVNECVSFVMSIEVVGRLGDSKSQ